MREEAAFDPAAVAATKARVRGMEAPELPTPPGKVTRGWGTPCSYGHLISAPLERGAHNLDGSLPVERAEDWECTPGPRLSNKLTKRKRDSVSLLHGATSARPMRQDADTVTTD